MMWREHMSARIWDGEYNRSDDTDFHRDFYGGIKPKGNGLLKSIAFKSHGFPVETVEWLCDFSGAEAAYYDQVTLFVAVEMQHNLTAHLYIYSIQITDASDNLLVDFSIGADGITMERTGTNQDYGYTGTL